MKRLFVICLCLLMAVSVFAGCSKGSEEKESQTAEQTTEHSHEGETVSQMPTDEAKISGSNAINLLKSYSEKELGLDKIDKDYQFLLSTSGSEIDGKKYIRAEAGAMEESGTNSEGKPTYQMTSYKTIYISYDGKTILVLNEDEYGEDKYDKITIDEEHLKSISTTAASSEKTMK